MPGFQSSTDPHASLGAWWRAVLAAAWVAGVALQLRQPALWTSDAYPLLAAAALAGRLVAGRVRRWRAIAGVAVAALGFAYAGWRADARVADALAPDWEGRDIELVGVVDDMPEVAEDGLHFAFAVDSARALPMSARAAKRLEALDAAAGRTLDLSTVRIGAPDDDTDDEEAGDGPDAAQPPPSGAPRVPSRLWLTWPGNPRDDHAVAATPAPLRAGQRWRLPVRLRLPHGALNPDGFDSELWLFDQGLRATGVVQGRGALIADGWAPIAQLREWVRDRLLLAANGGDAATAQAYGVLAALAVGDQAAIASGDRH